MSEGRSVVDSMTGGVDGTIAHGCWEHGVRMPMWMADGGWREQKPKGRRQEAEGRRQKAEKPDGGCGECDSAGLAILAHPARVLGSLLGLRPFAGRGAVAQWPSGPAVSAAPDAVARTQAQTGARP